MRLTFVTVDDDTLAETCAANEQMAAAMANVRMEEVPPAKVRAARESGRSAFPLPVADPRAETPTIAGPAGDIPLRIIRAARTMSTAGAHDQPVPRGSPARRRDRSAAFCADSTSPAPAIATAPAAHCPAPRTSPKIAALAALTTKGCSCSTPLVTATPNRSIAV